MIEITQNGPEVQELEVQTSSELPDVLPVLPLKETVAFPNTITPLAIGQERSVKLVNDVLTRDRMLVMVASKDPEVEEPGPNDVYDVGVLGIVARMLKMPDGTLRILVHGGQRVQLERVHFRRAVPDRAHPRAAGRPRGNARVGGAHAGTCRARSRASSREFPYLPEELQIAVANIDDPSSLAHMIAGSLRIKTEEKQELLEEVDVAKRLRRLSELLAHELEVMELGSKIQSQVQSEMDKTQREYFLRQQLKAIQDELGEADETQAEIERAS